MIASAILQARDTVIAGVIYDGEDARTMLTSFFNTATNLWSDAFLAGKEGVILTTMTTTTTDNDKDDSDDDDVVDKDNNKDPNGKDNDHFLTQQPTCGWMHSW